MFSFFRIALVALVASVSAASSRAAEVDPLLPKETEFVIQINVKQLVQADIVKKYYLPNIQKGLDSKEAQKVLMELGLDPLNDIERATVGLWGKFNDEMQMLIVIRGSFDAKKMYETAERYAKEKPDTLTLVKEGEVDLIQFKGDEKGKMSYVALVEGKPIIAGTDKKLVAAAVGLDAKGKPAISRDLALLVQKQDAKASFFMCGFTDGKFTEVPGDFGPLKNFGINGDKIKTGILQMKTLCLTLNFGKELGINVKMGMKDNDSADDFSAEFGKLANAAKTFLPILTASAPQAAGLLEDVAKTLTATSKDKDAMLTLKLSADSIEKATTGGKTKEDKEKEDKEKADKEKDK